MIESLEHPRTRPDYVTLVVIGIGFIALTLSLGASALGAVSGADVEPVDDASLGQRSNATVCDQGACVEAVLENAHWQCSGTDVSSFECNVSFWLNLTVRGENVCAEGSVNVTDQLAPSVCTGEVPVGHAMGGPVMVSYNARDSQRIVNVTGEVCLDSGASSVCEEWKHDPILLPSWDQWNDENPGSEVLGWHGTQWQHRVCLGDSMGFRASGDPGPGCSSGAVDSVVECEGLKEDRRCEVRVRLFLASNGPGICGEIGTGYGGGASALTCGFAHEMPSSSEGAPEVSRVYEHDEIPNEGRTVVVPIELCVWSFRPGSERHCDTFYEIRYLGGDPCACNGTTTEMILDIAKGGTDIAVTTGKHAKLPASVHP